MSRDLIFKTLKKSWARDDFTYKPSLAPAASTPKLVPTPEESARLKKLSDLRSRAESGDPKAVKEWRAAHTRVVALRVRSRGGDPKAVRACQVLEQSGVFGKSHNLTVSGVDVKSAAEILERARKGDTQAQETFRKMAAGAKGTPEGRAILDAVIKAHQSSSSGYGFGAPGGYKMTGLSKQGTFITWTAPFPDSTGTMAPAFAKPVTGITWSASGTFSGREEIMGSDDVFGEFVGDEERLARDAGPTERAASARISGPFSAIASRFARKGKRGHQGRRLSKLAWRASRGDAAAAAKLQQVTTRLQQRASSGDARATALLQKVQAVQARAQAQAQAAQQVAPTAAPTYAPPPAAPAPVANVTYSAPYASSDESEYVEEEY